MKKGCCDVKVKAVKNGYRIEVTGEGVKERCKAILDNCCFSEGRINFQDCCVSKE